MGALFSRCMKVVISPIGGVQEGESEKDRLREEGKRRKRKRRRRQDLKTRFPNLLQQLCPQCPKDLSLSYAFFVNSCVHACRRQRSTSSVCHFPRYF